MGRFGTPQISYNRYEVMWKALNATGRPILYSLCSWGEDYVHTVRRFLITQPNFISFKGLLYFGIELTPVQWGMSIANSWRMSGDIYDSFTRPDALCSCDNPRDPHCVAPGPYPLLLTVQILWADIVARVPLLYLEYHQQGLCIFRPCTTGRMERSRYVRSRKWGHDR
jgi:alpha-galactosidase